MQTYTEQQNQQLRRARFAIDERDIERFNANIEGFTAEQLQDGVFDYAVRQCFTEAVQTMQAKGCSPDKGSPVSALGLLCQDLASNSWLVAQPQAVETWKSLVEAEGLRTGKTSDGTSVLLHAMKAGLPESYVQPLIEKTQDFDVNKRGEHALLFAMSPRYSDAVRDSILASAPHLLTASVDGRQLAHEAVRRRVEHGECENPMAPLKWLKKNHASAFFIEEGMDNHSPLHKLCETYWRANNVQLQGELKPVPFPADALALLQDEFCDINQRDRLGRTPGMLALEVKRGWGTNINTMDMEEARTLKVLLDAGMDPLATDRHNETIHYALARNGFAKATEALLERIDDYAKVQANDRGMLPGDITADTLVQKEFAKVEPVRSILVERSALVSSLNFDPVLTVDVKPRTGRRL